MWSAIRSTSPRSPRGLAHVLDSPGPDVPGRESPSYHTRSSRRRNVRARPALAPSDAMSRGEGFARNPVYPFDAMCFAHSPRAYMSLRNVRAATSARAAALRVGDSGGRTVEKGCGSGGRKNCGMLADVEGYPATVPTFVGVLESKSCSRYAPISALHNGQRRDWLVHTPMHLNW
jgi:hypothetical protein